MLKAVALLSALAVVVGCSFVIIRQIRRPLPGSAEYLLERADEMAWNYDWNGAAPLYARAELLFRAKGELPLALYAKVSRIPVRMESESLPSLIAEMSSELKSLNAADPLIRLIILEVKGRCEEEYDAGLAAQTFDQMQTLALSERKPYLAFRAGGERGIMLFALGKFSEAATLVKRSYAVAKYLGDPAAHVKFASMIGRGLIQMDRPKQALVFLDEAIATQKQHPQVAWPYVAITAKVDCLYRLHRNSEALTLANAEIIRLRQLRRSGQLQSILDTRADVLMGIGEADQAIESYREASGYARALSAWRAVTDINAKLANAYLRSGYLRGALAAINEAIEANKQAPDEIFLAPGNLSLKAKILAALGQRSEAELVYRSGAQLVDVLLSAVPTPEIEDSLLAQAGDLFSGYFKLLADQGRLREAFSTIEHGRSRIEDQRLSFDATHAPDYADEKRADVVRSALRLLANSGTRGEQKILDEGVMRDTAMNSIRMAGPITLPELQTRLNDRELFVEYVLAEPSSFALVISNRTVKRYTLPAKTQIENDARRYRSVMLQHSSNKAGGQKLYSELLPFLDDYPRFRSVIVVADGDLYLLPFSALVTQSGHYLAQDKLITMTPSGTVLHALRSKAMSPIADNKSYLGVAPWADRSEQKSWVLARRGGDRTLLTPLPHTRDEVESIAAMMPQESTILVGDQATKANFASLPLRDYRVLHLALHGLMDPVFPDRSALVFAPTKQDDGRLEAHDIRDLPLRADLVTLSACNTGVGPATSAGVESIHAAFIQAGANSVVSSYWELDDAEADAFMKTFYRYLRYEDKASALRDAETEQMKQNASPYYWAAFELVGNPSGSPLRMPS